MGPGLWVGQVPPCEGGEGAVSLTNASPPPRQLRDCELSPGVNRDLTRRVRNVNGITQHKQILRNDIKLAAKLIHALDGRTRLWGAGEEAQLPTPVSVGFWAAWWGGSMDGHRQTDGP